MSNLNNDYQQQDDFTDEFLETGDLNSSLNDSSYEGLIKQELEKLNQEQDKGVENKRQLNLSEFENEKEKDGGLEEGVDHGSDKESELGKLELETVNNLDNQPAVLKVSDQETEEALVEKMKEMEINQQEEEIKQKASQQGLAYINLRGLPIMPEALELLEEEEARQKKVICFLYREGKEIRLAVVENNQQIKELVDRLKEGYPGYKIKVFLTSQNSLATALKLYTSLPKVIERVDDKIEISEEEIERTVQLFGSLDELKNRINQVSVTELFNLILAAAIKTEASDIHIEAGEKSVELRFRIDGVLHKTAQLNKEIWTKLSSRIKLKAGLKINVSDKPQDGNFSVNISDRPIDFRVSTLPTTYGESIVMRVLYHDKVKRMSLDNLGLADYNRRIIEEEIKKPNGLVVVTGPTGSGKTTTLYAILNKLNTPENKIITIEDPVEYKIQGINQSEVNASRGYTFAKALRSIVRQDPDIILVGEIRDKETVEIALNAALTGHLVFATLHTNNAVGVITRFLSLGAKSYLLSPALNISLAQRLVRKLCPVCKERVVLSEQDKELVRQEIEGLPDKYKVKFNLDFNQFKFYKAKGCQECAGLGYKGQLGIFEIFRITDEVRELISAENISETQLNSIARQNGMITMRQDGILKVIQGITSLDEVLRVA